MLKLLRQFSLCQAHGVVGRVVESLFRIFKTDHTCELYSEHENNGNRRYLRHVDELCSRAQARSRRTRAGTVSSPT